MALPSLHGGSLEITLLLYNSRNLTIPKMLKGTVSVITSDLPYIVDGLSNLQ